MKGLTISREVGSLINNKKEYINESLISATEESITLSINILKPPVYAHNNGFWSASWRIVSITAFLNESSALSANEIKETANNRGKF